MYMQKLACIVEIKIGHAQRFHNFLKAVHKLVPLKFFSNGISRPPAAPSAEEPT